MAMRPFFTRRITLLLKPHSPICNSSSKASSFLDKEPKPTTHHPTRTILPSLLEQTKPHSSDFKIELIDSDTWHFSSGLSESWRRTRTNTSPTKPHSPKTTDDCQTNFSSTQPDFDEIEDMRIRGNLFYKLDRDSREFKEYNFDFHRRKKNKEDNKKEPKKNEKPKSNPNPNLNSNPNPPKREKVEKNVLDSEMGGDKKMRTQTFNQLTAAYHEPFCLDIYISKSSVRACIVHRVTSKVVAVAHSISKDMKFDLVSTRDYNACAAVGGVLAQRALADDIHDVVYTPRKGEKVEGKLQTVLQSVIDNGINVKVKLKQRKTKKVQVSLAEDSGFQRCSVPASSYSDCVGL